jgi:hypothetical protein
VSTVHRVVAYAIPTGWAFLALCTLWAFVRNRAPRDWFWSLLAVLQVALVVQALVGSVLFVMGHRPDSSGPQWLHYLYGAVGPAIVLAFAHRWARRYETISWAVFGVAALVIFGLTFRALSTGLGIG